MSSSSWPIFKSYKGDYLRRIALPMGGIGTGNIALGGRGDWRDWEIVNRPAKGFTPQHCFFALRAATGDDVFCRVLEGPIPTEDYEGSAGCEVANHGLPRFASATFGTAYPLAQIELDDPQSPLRVSLQSFNPLIPGDAKASGFPVAVARFRVENRTEQTVDVSICGSFSNFIGTDGTDFRVQDNRNERRDGASFRAIMGKSAVLPQESPVYGTLALALFEDDAEIEVSHRTSWADLGWGDSLLEFWDDFSSDGRLEERERGNHKQPTGSLSASFSLPAGQSKTVTWIWAWHFPNRLSWSPEEIAEGVPVATSPGGSVASGEPVIGNFYSGKFADAGGALDAFVPRLPDLEAQTVAFARAFYDSDLPDVVKEAAGFNLSTLHSPTVFRTPDGHFFGWEGAHDRFGSCYGSCTHVWNYEQATPFLFGEMARSMREIEFEHMTDERGMMHFRVGLPLDSPTLHGFNLAAADGQMGCLMKLFREWKLCGDDDWLRRLWPQAKRVLEFCWIEGGWDGDRDGVMEGCQHNTMDVEYFGPNPQMQGWYLGALRASEEMARALGEEDFAAKCRELFDNGSRWMDANLWNGDYYEHHIAAPVPPAEAIAEGLGGKHQNRAEPEFQLGAGCLVDQLVGEYMAQVCDLAPLLSPDHVRQTLASVVRFNGRDSMRGHFNHLRSFALGEESALLMASYPRDRRPSQPFPYFNEVMTGFEHTVAAHLIFIGENEAGLTVMRNIRERYDGKKRNPFDEAECGRHYARAMASWASVLALTGFHFDAATQTMRFSAAKDDGRRDFWSNGSSWGTCIQRRDGDGIEVALQVLGGSLSLKVLELSGLGRVELTEMKQMTAGDDLNVRVTVQQ